MPSLRKDYYKILQVDASAEPEVIDAAYKRLALKYHPDLNKSPTALARMQEMNEAYEVLANPARRRDYDLTRRGYPQAPVRETDWRPDERPPQTEQAAPASRASTPNRKGQASYAESRDRLVPLSETVAMAFVRIPSGTFRMGSDPLVDRYALSNEMPQHAVTLGEYWIGKFPVTVAQFSAFIASTGYQTWAENQGHSFYAGEAEADGASWEHPGGLGTNVLKRQNHPVTHVTWEDARAFCEWAALMSGLRIGLPTEAQWEKTARGHDGRIYPWGNQTPMARLCNFDGLEGGTTPVGKYSPQGDSPYGCADMAGNVWEWVADWYAASEYASTQPEGSFRSAAGANGDPFHFSPGGSIAGHTVRDPAGASFGTLRVFRGGSSSNRSSLVRSAARGSGYPGTSLDNLGFRCAILSEP